MLESQCPNIYSFYLYPKAKYGNLYLAPHFDVGRLGRIWLQANIEKTNVCKSRIFEIQVFVFDYGQISTRRMFENLRFQTSNFSYLTTGEYRKVGFIKVGEKISRDIGDIRVFDLAKMAVCFEKKFLFDPEGNFKNVEIEAKNGDLGLGNGHGSKRSLFVTEDFAEEDGELQRTIIKKLFIQMYCHCLD